MFSGEFGKNFTNTFSYRTPPVAASGYIKYEKMSKFDYIFSARLSFFLHIFLLSKLCFLIFFSVITERE